MIFMTAPTINNPRAEIDAIDGELLRLLNKRAEIALRRRGGEDE